MAITHNKVSAQPDSTDPDLVQASDWNADHVIEEGSIGTDELADDANPNLVNAYTGRFFRWTDDWFYAGPMYCTFTGTSGTPVGHHTLTMQGTARLVGVTGSGRLGLVSLQAGETADGQCRVHTCAMGAFDAGGQANMQTITYEAVVAIENKSTALEEFRVEVGLVGNSPGYGAFFRYDRANNGGVHRWSVVAENLGTETVAVLDGTTNGGIATVDAGTIDDYSLPTYSFFRLKVVLDGTAGVATSAKYYVKRTSDDDYFLAATITTNLPTHSLAGSVEIMKTAGTTSRAMVVDYTELTYQFLADRTP